MDDALLDDTASLMTHDPQGVLLALAGAGAQVRQAQALTEETRVASWTAGDRPRAVLVAARGGGAIVGAAMATLIGRSGPVPVMKLTGSTLPQWVGPMDMVIALSLSGRSDPTINVAYEAGRRGAMMLTVGTAGSALEEASAIAKGIHVALPEPNRGVIAVPTSRTALWSLLTPAFVACQHLGLLREADVDLAHVADSLDAEAEACRPDSEAFVNPAKSLAMEIADHVPVLLGADEVAAVAAQRASAVLSRTARIPAAHGGLPDDAGDIVATFGGPFVSNSVDDIFADPLAGDPAPGAQLRLVVLGREDGRNVREVTTIAEKAGVRVSHVPCTEEGELASLAQLIARTDFAATYLALGNGIDPSINPHVADLRDALG